MLRHLFRPRNVRPISSPPNVLLGIDIPKYQHSFRHPRRYHHGHAVPARSNAVLRTGSQQ